MLTPTQIALNSTVVEVTLRDGTTQPVSVRQLDIEGLYLFIECINAKSMPRIIAHAIGKDLSWVNLLSAKSAAALAKLVCDQNFTEAMEIVQTDPIAAMTSARLLVDLSASYDLLRKSSAASLPEPQLSVSKEAPGSDSSSSPQGA